jgi:IclR family KDG regulon transcriptional repressor
MTNAFYNAEQSRGMVKSVLKAAALLRLFTTRHQAWGVSEMSRALGTSKTVTYNLAETLVAGGLLDFDGVGKKYRVGLLSYQLGLVFSRDNDFYSTARVILKSVCDKTNNTIVLSILDKDEVFILASVENANAFLRVVSMEGEHRPLHSSAVGRAMLSCLTIETLDKLIPPSLPAHTTRTITSKPEYMAMLRQAKIDGYAMQDEQLVDGITSVAVPVFDQTGVCVAAISANYVKASQSETDIAKLAATLKDASQAMTESVGGELRSLAEKSVSPYYNPPLGKSKEEYGTKELMA